MTILAATSTINSGVPLIVHEFLFSTMHQVEVIFQRRDVLYNYLPSVSSEYIYKYFSKSNQIER